MKNTTALPALLLGLLISLPVWGQGTSQLFLEVKSSQGVTIFAEAVTYGEVLRAFRQKFGVPIKIPEAADQLLLSYALIDANTPAEALEKLLTGSGLGYAFLWEVGCGQLEKVIVFYQREESRDAVQAHASGIDSRPSNPPALSKGSALFKPAGRDADEEANNRDGEMVVSAVQRRPLTEAGRVIGMEDGPEAAVAVAEQFYELPPAFYPVVRPLDSLTLAGLHPEADLGMQNFDPLPVIRPLSEAAAIMGVPPDISPAVVGKTKTYPLPPDEKRP